MSKKVTKKKDKESSFGGLFDRILGSLFESVEENAEDLLEKLGDFAFLKSAIKKQIIFLMFVFVGVIIFSMGLGLMINDFLPIIKPWMAYIVLGILLYVAGLIYRGSK